MLSRILAASIRLLVDSGAEHATPVAALTETLDADRISHPNTLLRVDGKAFLDQPVALQEEAFGNASLVVLADSVAQVCAIVDSLEGNLTGCVYSATGGSDDEAYDQIAPQLRAHVGRLLNDKMPTGVAVSPAMNHGGPFPATGHPGFTAVGIPASFASASQCFSATITCDLTVCPLGCKIRTPPAACGGQSTVRGPKPTSPEAYFNKRPFNTATACGFGQMRPGMVSRFGKGSCSSVRCRTNLSALHNVRVGCPFWMTMQTSRVLNPVCACDQEWLQLVAFRLSQSTVIPSPGASPSVTSGPSIRTGSFATLDS